jgi:hypothetical protein
MAGRSREPIEIPDHHDIELAPASIRHESIKPGAASRDLWKGKY